MSSNQEAPGSALRPKQASKLMVPGSLTKRARPGSVDLETGLDAKKMKMAPPETKTSGSNLSRAKSKSTMNISSTVRGRLTTTNTRQPISSRTTLSNRTVPDRRATTASALNRTDKENRFSREKSTVGGLNREKSTVSRPPAKPSGKRPAWDVKGRLEDMEAKFAETMKRVGVLENEKEAEISNLKKKISGME